MYCRISLYYCINSQKITQSFTQKFLDFVDITRLGSIELVKIYYNLTKKRIADYNQLSFSLSL